MLDEYWALFSPKMPLPLLYVKSLIWFNIPVKKPPEHKLTINDVKKRWAFTKIDLFTSISFICLFIFVLADSRTLVTYFGVNLSQLWVWERIKTVRCSKLDESWELNLQTEMQIFSILSGHLQAARQKPRSVNLWRMIQDSALPPSVCRNTAATIGTSKCSVVSLEHILSAIQRVWAALFLSSLSSAIHGWKYRRSLVNTSPREFLVEIK